MNNTIKMLDEPVFEDGMVAYRYFDGSRSLGDNTPNLVKYRIIKRTSKGFKIEDDIKGVVRQVFVGSCTQYAYEDKLRALEAYRNRKIKQRLILEQQLKTNMAHYNNINKIEFQLETGQCKKEDMWDELFTNN